MSENRVTSEREQQVNQLMDKNLTSFLEWQNLNHIKQSLDIPQEVANVLIPRRILEISQDPSKVQAIIMDGWPFSQASSRIFFIIRERLTTPVTDSKQFEKWRTDSSYSGAMSEFAQKANIGSGSYLFMGKDVLLEGIDYMYAKYYFAFGKKGISHPVNFILNDKIYLHY